MKIEERSLIERLLIGDKLAELAVKRGEMPVLEVLKKLNWDVDQLLEEAFCEIVDSAIEKDGIKGIEKIMKELGWDK